MRFSSVGRFVEEKDFCLNRLPIFYNPKAPQPEAWLQFLSELLEPEDILTLQELMGYCLIPCTRGQVMLLIKGNGGEGKSRIGVVMHALFGPNAKNGSIDKVENSAFARADLQHVLVEKSELLPHRERVRISYFYQRYYILSLHPRFCLSQNRGLRMFEKTIFFGRSYFSSACLTASGSPGPGLSFWS